MKRKYSIDEACVVDCGGVKLHARVRGTDEKNPVILFLHGGPGVCDRHWVLKYQSALADAATLVCYDQRGAGKSYTSAQAKETMCVSDMVEDANAMVDWACARFHQEKILIVGHSWGSCLGTLLCIRYPAHILAYVGMGQLANGPENERISYEFVWNEALRRGDRKAQKDLARIGAPVNGLYRSLDDLTVQRNYMTKYGGGEYKESGSIWRSMIIPLLRSPEYRLFDLPKYAKGAFYNLRELWDEVAVTDFFADAPSIPVPVYITQGRHDRNTPSELAEEWFARLAAPKKAWYWFEESAHSPIKEEPEKWGSVLHEILADTQKQK